MPAGIKALRKLQTGKEATKGTAVAATARILGDIAVRDAAEKVTLPERDYGVLSQHFDLGEILIQLCEVELAETELSFEQVHYPLIAAFGDVTATEQTVGQGDYLRTFTPPASTKPAPKTLTFEYVEDDGAGVVQKLQATFGFTKSMTIRAEKGPNYAALSAMWVARGPTVLGTVATVGLPSRTLIPSEIVSVHFATTLAGLGNAVTEIGEPAKLTNINSVEWEFTVGLTEKRILGGSKDFDREKSIKRVATLRINMDLDATAETERASFFRAAAERAIRLKAKGAQIGTGKNKLIAIDGAYQLVSWPAPGEDENESTVDLEYVSTYESAGAKDLEIKTISTLSTIP